MVNILKKIVLKMTSAVLAWVEEDGMSSTVPTFTAGGTADLQLH